MKVYELMSILENLPSGMEVRAMDSASSKARIGTISSYESDGVDADGLLTLIFYGEK